ncbi:MAG: high-affinity nickel transporter, partial [Phycisphaerales bacterium]|nr:high-affinity nickel transporter [Phycisphaerales bacterium]
ITAVSVVIAITVGGIEVLGMLADRLNLHGPGWDTINSLGTHMGAIGILIIAIFVLSWAASTLATG